MKFNKNLVYTLWSAGIILCVILAVFALLFTSCKKQSSETGDTDFSTVTERPQLNTDATPAPDTPEETPVPAQTPTPVRLTATADAGMDYQDKIIFLGDSTTYGLKYYGVLSGGKDTTQVWTPSSGTLTLSNYAVATIVYPETGEEITIEDAVSRKKPEYLLITLGVNGVSFMDEEWFIRDYTALVELVQKASPDTKIILNSIYPVADSYKYKADISNEKIKAANGWIERIAEATGVRFLYSFETVVGADGNLPEESQNGDGLHLTGEAFNTVLNYVRTHAYQ